MVRMVPPAPPGPGAHSRRIPHGAARTTIARAAVILCGPFIELARDRTVALRSRMDPIKSWCCRRPPRLGAPSKRCR